MHELSYKLQNLAINANLGFFSIENPTIWIFELQLIAENYYRYFIDWSRTYSHWHTHPNVNASAGVISKMNTT